MTRCSCVCLSFCVCFCWGGPLSTANFDWFNQIAEKRLAMDLEIKVYRFGTFAKSGNLTRGKCSTRSSSREARIRAPFFP